MVHRQRSLPGSLGYLCVSVAANRSLAAGLIPLSSKPFHCRHGYRGQLLHCRVFKINADGQQVTRAEEEAVPYSKGTDSYSSGAFSERFPAIIEMEPCPTALILDFCFCVMLFAASIVNSFVASDNVWLSTSAFTLGHTSSSDFGFGSFQLQR